MIDKIKSTLLGVCVLLAIVTIVVLMFLFDLVFIVLGVVFVLWASYEMGSAIRRLLNNRLFYFSKQNRIEN